MFKTTLLAAVAATALCAPLPAKAFTAEQTSPAGRFVVMQGHTDAGVPVCSFRDFDADNQAYYQLWRGTQGRTEFAVALKGVKWASSGTIEAWIDDQRYVLTMEIGNEGQTLNSVLIPDDFRHALYNGQVLTLLLNQHRVIFSLQGSAVALAVLYHCAGALDQSAPAVTTAAVTPGPIAVPVRRAAGGIYASVTINGSTTVPVMIDSGATSVVLPRRLIKEMIADGTLTPADFLGMTQATMADGRVVPTPRFLLRSITIAGHTVTDVRCLGSDGDEVLLGQTFLDRFRSWSIDNAHGLLLLDK